MERLETIRNRVDQFGVTEPVLVRQGADQIVVQLPGIQDPQRALDLIGQTAQMEFKLVDDTTSLNLPDLSEQALKSGKLKPGYTREQLNQALAEWRANGRLDQIVDHWITIRKVSVETSPR